MDKVKDVIPAVMVFCAIILGSLFLIMLPQIMTKGGQLIRKLMAAFIARKGRLNTAIKGIVLFLATWYLVNFLLSKLLYFRESVLNLMSFICLICSIVVYGMTIIYCYKNFVSPNIPGQSKVFSIFTLIVLAGIEILAIMKTIFLLFLAFLWLVFEVFGGA